MGRTAQDSVQLLAQRFEPVLIVLPNYIDFRVIGDSPQHDVGGAFVHKALSNIAMCDCVGLNFTANVLFLLTSLKTIGQVKIGKP